MKKEKLEQVIEDTLTQDINNLLYDAITTAVDKKPKFEADYPEAIPRTVSSFLHDEMCSEVERRLPKLTGNFGRAIIVKKNGTMKLSIDNGKIVIRFKKMKRNGVTSNIVTQPVLEFEQMNLFQEESIKLNVGYCYTHDGLEYDVIISHPSGLHSIDWCRPITYENDNIEQFTSSVPAQTTNSQRQRKLLPRKGAVKHAKVDKS